MLACVRSVQNRTLLKIASRQTGVWTSGFSSRCYSASSEPKPVTCVLDEETGIATVTLNNKPVNTLSMDVMHSLTDHFTRFSQSKQCKAVILASALPNVYCAGLQLTELLNPDPERLAIYWKSLHEMWHSIYTVPQYVMATINGAALAGGCVVALACDYRIMTTNEKHTIGLIEPVLGLPTPHCFMKTFVNQCGMNVGEQALALGTAFTPSQALRVGLVHELTDTADEEQFRSKVEQIIKNVLKVPHSARAEVKRRLRQPVVDEGLARRTQDQQYMVKLITSPEFQSILTSYLANLKKQKK